MAELDIVTGTIIVNAGVQVVLTEAGTKEYLFASSVIPDAKQGDEVILIGGKFVVGGRRWHGKVVRRGVEF